MNNLDLELMGDLTDFLKGASNGDIDYSNIDDLRDKLDNLSVKMSDILESRATRLAERESSRVNY